jgi:hypothetical protein
MGRQRPSERTDALPLAAAAAHNLRFGRFFPLALRLLRLLAADHNTK